MSQKGKKLWLTLWTFECEQGELPCCMWAAKTPLCYWSFKLVPFPWVQACCHWWSSAGWERGLNREFLVCSWSGHVQVSEKSRTHAKSWLVKGLSAGIQNGTAGEAAGSLAGVSTFVWMSFLPGEPLPGCDFVHQDPCLGLKIWDLFGSVRLFSLAASTLSFLVPLP